MVIKKTMLNKADKNLPIAKLAIASLIIARLPPMNLTTAVKTTNTQLPSKLWHRQKKMTGILSTNRQKRWQHTLFSY